MLTVDAHLDLAYNALRGRDVLLPAARQARDEEGIPSVGLPDLRAGSVGLICATIFCEPKLWKDRGHGYTNAEEAHALAEQQLAWYEARAAEGHVRFVRTAADLPAEDGPIDGPIDGPLPVLILLEGADPIRTPDDARAFFDRGLRLVGLAWKRTRFAGGTGDPGRLTDEGVALVAALDRLGIIHDASHLAEESFWHLLDVSAGPVIASHSNCRAIVRTEPANRHLSDEMIRAIVRRGGVIGINFYEKFLVPAEQYKKRRASLADVVAHARHICDVAGSTVHVGIGTDMDGGFGAEHVPEETPDASSLPRVAEALSSAGFADADVRGIMGLNFLRFFRRSLPRVTS